MSNKCPICQKDDQLIKASAIVQGGTHNISGQVPVSRTYQDSNGLQERTSYESYHATQQSSLAQKLTPPKKPSSPSKPPIFPLIAVGIWTLLMLGQAISSILEGYSILYSVLMFLGIGLIPLALAYFAYQKNLSNFPKQLASANSEIQKWEHAMNRWNRLYYCYRDDCIFVIDSTSYSEPSKMKEYIYQP